MLSSLLERDDFIEGLDTVCYEGPKDYHTDYCVKMNRLKKRLCPPVDDRGFVIPADDAEGNGTLNNVDPLQQTAAHITVSDASSTARTASDRSVPRICHTEICKAARSNNVSSCLKQYSDPRMPLQLSHGACPTYADYVDLCVECAKTCNETGCTAKTGNHCVECQVQFSQYRRDERQCFQQDQSLIKFGTSATSFANFNYQQPSGNSSGNPSRSLIFQALDEEYRCTYLAKAPTVRVKTIKTVEADKGFSGQLVASLLLAALLLGFILTARDNSAIAYGVAILDEMVVTEQFAPMHISPSLTNKTSYLYERNFEDTFSENGWYDFLELVAFPALAGWGGQTTSSTGQSTELIFGEFLPLTTIELSAIHVHEQRDCGEFGCYPHYDEGKVEEANTFHGKFTKAPANCENFFYLGHMVWKYGCERYSLEVSHTTSVENASIIVDEMRQYRFGHSPSVRLLALATYLYHVELETIYSLKTIAEVSPTGGLRTWSKIVPMPMQPVTSLGILCIIAALMYLFMTVYTALRHCVRSLDVTRDSNNIPSTLLWLLIDIACVCTNITLAILSLGFLQPATDSMKDKIHEMIRTSAYESFSRNYDEYINLDTLERYEHALSIIAFVTIVAVFLRLLVFANLVKEIRCVTKAISNAAQSTISLVLIFTIVVAGFAIASTILWGGVMENFRSMKSSMNFLFTMLLGDMDYDQMSEFSSPAAFIFILLYLVTALCILLNFIIAILTASLDDSQTVPNIPFKSWLWWHLHCKYDAICDLFYSPRDYLDPRNRYRNDCCAGLLRWESNAKRISRRKAPEVKEEGLQLSSTPTDVNQPVPLAADEVVSFREVTAWARKDENPSQEIDPTKLSDTALQRAKRQWYYLVLKDTVIHEQATEEEVTKDPIEAHFKKSIKNAVRGPHFDEIMQKVDKMYKEASISHDESNATNTETSDSEQDEATREANETTHPKGDPSHSLGDTLRGVANIFVGTSNNRNKGTSREPTPNEDTEMLVSNETVFRDTEILDENAEANEPIN